MFRPGEHVLKHGIVVCGQLPDELGRDDETRVKRIEERVVL